MAKTATCVLRLMDLSKFRKIRATRWLLWHSDFTKFDFSRGFAPDPDQEAYDAPQTSSVFTCIGALGTPPAEGGPSLESIYRVSLTVGLCERR